ncbi:hypothetical protein [Streptomyces sp. NPDC059076]|uniref:hypothetical protein n=1 Tax=unclassified Streptomyces TaxID=2593676 RepID=UPI0036C2F8C0
MRQLSGPSSLVREVDHQRELGQFGFRYLLDLFVLRDSLRLPRTTTVGGSPLAAPSSAKPHPTARVPMGAQRLMDCVEAS